MLLANTGTAPRATIPHEHHADARLDAVWLDLVSPTDQERSAVERATGLRVPAQADIAEIESSSRLLTEGNTLFLSMPLAYFDREREVSAVSPIGFVLTADRLVTIRFAELQVFDQFAQRFATGGRVKGGAAFVGLIEAIIDRAADALETVGTELDAISHAIFGREGDDRENSNQIDARLRETLRRIGRLGDRLANSRDSLVGAQRIVSYVGETRGGVVDAALTHRCSTVRADITSLLDYNTQLGNKVQFLLDATLGFINIEQNNGIKVLTVVSVVGVPPTLVASIYGMNFKWIPELEWHYGYFYGLIVIALSAVVPLWWFRKRGWI